LGERFEFDVTLSMRRRCGSRISPLYSLA